MRIRFHIDELELRASMGDASADKASVRFVIHEDDAGPLPQQSVMTMRAAESGEPQRESARQMDEGERILRVPRIPLARHAYAHGTPAAAGRSFA